MKKINRSICIILIILFSGLLATSVQSEENREDSGQLGLLQTLQYHELWVAGRGYSQGAISWQPSGDMLAVGSTLGVWLYSPLLEDIAHLEFPNQSGWPNTVAWNPNGRELAMDFGHIVFVWDVATSEIVATLDIEVLKITSIVWSPDGKSLAVGASNGTIYIWKDSLTQTLTLSGHSRPIRSLAWSSDSTRLASVGADEKLVLCDVAAGQLETTIETGMEDFQSVSWHPENSNLLVTASRDTLSLWNIESASQMSTPQVQIDVPGILAAEWDASGSMLVTWNPEQIEIWKTASLDNGEYSPDIHIPARMNKSAKVAWRSNGEQIAVLDADNLISIWDLGLMADIPQLVQSRSHGHGFAVDDIAWSPDASMIASSGEDGTARIWNAYTGEPAALWSTGYALKSVSWNSDGTELAIAGYDSAVVWNVESDDIVFETPPKGVYTMGVSWHPNESLFASGRGIDGYGSYPASIGIWDSDAGQLLVTLGQFNWALGEDMVAWSPDGNMIAFAGANPNTKKGVAEIWTAPRDGDTQVPEDPIDTIIFPDGSFVSLSWSPDSYFLSIGDTNGEIHLWNSTNHEIQTFQAHDGIVVSLAWSPDGMKIASVSDADDTVRIWDTTSYEQLATIPVNGVNSLTWSPDGTLIAMARRDGTIRVWGE